MTRWLSVISTPPVLCVLPLATGDPPTDFYWHKNILDLSVNFSFIMTRVYIRVTTPTQVTNPAKSSTNVYFLCVKQISWMTNSQLQSVLLWTFKESWENFNLMKIAMGSNRYWYGLFIVFNTFNTVPFPNYQIFSLIYFDFTIDVCINGWTIQVLKPVYKCQSFWTTCISIRYFIIEMEKVAV